MMCLTCDTYPCVCHWVPPRKSDTVMSEARALVGVILLVVALGWAFWYGTKLNDARWSPTHTTTTTQGDTQ